MSLKPINYMAEHLNYEMAPGHILWQMELNTDITIFGCECINRILLGKAEGAAFYARRAAHAARKLFPGLR